MSYQEFLESINPMQAELISYVDRCFLEVDGVGRKMRYKIPFYDYKTWICYLNPQGKNHVELCFLYAKKLQQHFPILQFKGRKMVAGLMLDAEEDIPAQIIIDILNMAISLNNNE